MDVKLNPMIAPVIRTSAPAKPPSVAVANLDSFQVGGAPATLVNGASIRAAAAAPPPHNVTVTEVKTPVSGFASTELLVDHDPHFPQQNFGPRGKIQDPELIAAFGSDSPPSSEALLHYAGAPPAGAPKRGEPMLFIQGANVTGKFFADPHRDGSFKDSAVDFFRKQGYEVYSISFADNQDENFLQAQQVKNAIDRIKEKTGADKIDLVAHSKGGMAARIYESNVDKPSWMTPYGNDVNRSVYVSCPNGGLDYPFRHSGANLVLASPLDSPALNAPMTWDSMKVFGTIPIDTTNQSYESKTQDWKGQSELLARWDKKYPLNYFEGMDPLTVDTSYNGGDSLLEHSPGIDKIIKDGGNLIQRLDDAKIDPKIGVALLAGDNPDIPGILNETGGPSDGLLFVKSALNMPSTDHILEKKTLHENHLDMISSAEGQKAILDALTRPDPKA